MPVAESNPFNEASRSGANLSGHNACRRGGGAQAGRAEAILGGLLGGRQPVGLGRAPATTIEAALERRAAARATERARRRPIVRCWLHAAIMHRFRPRATPPGRARFVMRGLASRRVHNGALRSITSCVQKYCCHECATRGVGNGDVIRLRFAGAEMQSPRCSSRQGRPVLNASRSSRACDMICRPASRSKRLTFWDGDVAGQPSSG
jgi:hypothetical protein